MKFYFFFGYGACYGWVKAKSLTDAVEFAKQNTHSKRYLHVMRIV